MVEVNFKLSGTYALLLFAQTCIQLQAQLFEVDTKHENGRYSFTFSDGFWPVTFDVSNGSGSVFFNFPDATEIDVPDSWLIDERDKGFSVSYDGVFDIYPLGFEEVEISFLSGLETDEIGTPENDFAGIALGPVVLESGYSQGIDLGNETFTTAPVGFQKFYFDMPAYDGPPLSAQALINTFGFTLDEIKPIAADIKVVNDEVRISLDNVVEDATYMLQFKASLSAQTWINLKTFTHEDLDENNSIGHPVEGLAGFFQVSLL